jgi:uncharacterized protein
MMAVTKNKLHVKHINLKEGKQKFHQEVTVEDLDIAKLNFIGPIAIDAELFKNGDTVVVSGNITFRLLLSCVSCLENYEKDFSQGLYQEYVKTTKPMTVETARLEGIDFVREYFTADYLDLMPIIRDTILLAIPVAPWCREDCPGVIA